MIIIVIHEAMWFVEVCMTLRVVWFVVIDRMRMVTSCASCCAKCHFHPFLSFSSITMPPSWKMLPSSKTPENSTLWAYRLILSAYDTIRSHFRYYRTKIRKWQIKIEGAKKWICSTSRITWCAFFGKHHLPSLSKSYLLPFTQLFTLYQIFYHILLYQISYSLQLYRYYNTVTTMQHIVTIL